MKSKGTHGWSRFALAIIGPILLLAACSAPTPTPVPTATPVPPTATPTATAYPPSHIVLADSSYELVSRLQAIADTVLGAGSGWETKGPTDESWHSGYYDDLYYTFPATDPAKAISINLAPFATRERHNAALRAALQALGYTQQQSLTITDSHLNVAYNASQEIVACKTPSRVELFTLGNRTTLMSSQSPAPDIPACEETSEVILPVTPPWGSPPAAPMNSQPTAMPVPTGTPTPIPQIFASEEARQCLFNPDCSGLFANPYRQRVLKALPLREAARTGYAEYWLVNGPEYWQDVIRNKIMPTLAQWTNAEWRELKGPEPPGADILRWYNNAPHDWGYECDAYRVAGCAIPGNAEIIVLYDSTWNGKPYPDEILYQIGLHEAVHALYHVEQHAQAGLMCVNPDCYRPLGPRWPKALAMRPLDEEVYTVYGNPLLTHYMTRQRAELIIQTRLD